MVAAADQPTLLMNIADMIDLSIGSPETGVVDFNMLHTVLHCLAQQLRVLEKNVELQGDIALTHVGDMEAMKTVNIDEYLIETDQPRKEGTTEETLLTVQRIPKLEAEATKDSPLKPGKTDQPPSDWKKSRVSQQLSGKGQRPDTQEKIDGAQKKTASDDQTKDQTTGDQTTDDKRRFSGDKISLVTISKFNVLENTVENLKARVYGSIPKNEEILEEVRSQSNLKSITDLWTSLNVSSRLEAAESAIEKLSSLIEDMIGENNNMKQIIKTCQSSITGMDAVNHAIRDANKIKQREAAAVKTGGTPDKAAEEWTSETADKVALSPAIGEGEAGQKLEALAPGETADLSIIQKALLEIREDVNKLAHDVYSGALATGPGMDMSRPAYVESAGTDGTGFGGTVGTDGSELTGGGGGTEARGGVGQTGMVMDASGKPSPALFNLMIRVNDIDNKLKECCDTAKKHHGKVSDQIINLQDQLEGVLKQMGAVTEATENGLTQDVIKDLKGLMQLFHTVQEMQQELKQVHDTALQLAAEKEHRQQNLNAIVEQIELLKTIKMDREDILEAMADKADITAVARKVSFDQFEMACDDLSKGLEQALGKLGLQEAIWQQALDDIQREIEAKLDKIELMPVKDFFNSKLRQLQESLKEIAQLRREAEAAGTKRKLLRDVNCISCDAKACMQTEPTQVAVQRPFPATLSMKPYLSYELDAIRKTQECIVPQRNMHDWEQIEKQMTSKVPRKVRSETDKHICNRYCGGSHTRTTPAQRVARTGHFLKQWGPDVLPLSSGYAAGDDGRMYKISVKESASVGPDGTAPKSGSPPERMSKRESSQRVDPRLTPSVKECLCLEPEPGQNARQNIKERPVSAK